MNTGSEGGEGIKILITNYGAGNLRSVTNAFRLLHADTKIVNIDNLSEETIKNFDALVLPGVGNFEILAKAIKGKEKIFRNLSVPFLGICLGLQILLNGSEEAENADGVGIIEGKNVMFKCTDLKVPHIGWNKIKILKNHPVLNNLDNKFFYFVHSYYANPKNYDCVFAICNYGVYFPAVIIKKNFIATQFHPEKSGESGIRFLKNFVNFVRIQTK